MPNLYEQLPTLLELQDLDEQIRQLEVKRQTFPRQQKIFEAQLEKRRASQGSKTEEQKALQLEHRAKTKALDSNQEQIQKWRAQLLQIKTNREYTALETEISHMEDENAFIEDRILEILLRLDEIKAEVEESSQLLGRYEAAFDKKIVELNAGLQDLNRQIAEYKNKRETICADAGLSPDLCQRYDNWVVRKKTTFVAPVVGSICGACHLGLRPQLVNLLHRRDDLLTCTNCGRVLYLVPAEAPTQE